MINEKKLIEKITTFGERMTNNGMQGDFHIKIIKAIIDIIANQVKVGEWIPCSERLPETSEPVLVFTDSHTQEIWNLIKDEDGDYWEDDYGYGQILRDAIAWMPLPNAYNAERGGKNE